MTSQTLARTAAETYSTSAASNPMNHLDRVWAQMSSADRHALLGHDRDVLAAADKIRLARAAAALRRQQGRTRRRAR